jgi:DNA adenine methylase
MMRSARPVLKWAGGKSRSVPEILARMPKTMNTFFEPFIGGAAVFFALAAEGRFQKAVLGDRNEDLIGVYRVIKKDVESLIECLEAYAKRVDKDEYYAIRGIDPSTLDEVERAARIIYLNKTGYNGLYRVNSKGQFNVPYGRYKRPTICNAENLRGAAKVLRRAKLVVGDFETVVAKARAGDGVYFDPPYVPVSRTASFTAYHHDPFGLPDHERLARVFTELGRRGVPAVLSNSLTAETTALYRRFKPEHIQVARPINSRGTGRGAVAELLVVNRRRR